MLQSVVFSKSETGREEDKIRWVPSKKICLVLNLSIVSWVVMIVIVFLGKVFGELKFC